MTQAEWRAEVVRRLRINEGVSNTMYHDSVGVPTIANGFNLQRGDARSVLASVGADYDAVMNGAALTDAQVEGVLAVTLADFDNGKSLWELASESLQPSHFDTWLTDARKVVVCDLTYNLGDAGWDAFGSTRSLIDQGCHDLAIGHADDAHASFNGAADHLTASAWASQVGDRARRDIAMLRSSVLCDPNGNGSDVL